MPTDRTQQNFTVGDVVNIPIVVTAIAGTAARPTVTGTTKYEGFDGSAADSLGPIDCIQVIKDQATPKS